MARDRRTVEACGTIARRGSNGRAMASTVASARYGPGAVRTLTRSADDAPADDVGVRAGQDPYERFDRALRGARAARGADGVRRAACRTARQIGALRDPVCAGREQLADARWIRPPREQHLGWRRVGIDAVL